MNRFGDCPPLPAALDCRGTARPKFRFDACEVKMRLLKSMFAFGIVAAVLCMNTQASHAYQTGDSKWCTVTNKGADSIQWECEYDTSDECAAAVAGTGGYCAINPFWRPDQSSTGH